MKAAQTALLTLLSVSPAVCRGQVNRAPHIGYLFPAGAQRGKTIEVLVGGQRLRAAKGVHVTGKGVRATVVEHYRPPRNIMREQREELKRQLGELQQARIAELPPARRKNVRSLKKLGQKTKANADDAKEGRVKLPDHPMLRDLENESLRGLQHLINEFVYVRSYRKRQLNAQLAEILVIKLTVASNALPGDRELRLITPQGLTNPVCFQVGTLPEKTEQEPNEPGPTMGLPPVPASDLPVLLNGQIMPGDVDRFRFRAKQGQQLLVRTHARRLVPFLADAVPGWFQATVAVFDAAGHEIAFADDFAFDPDPVLHCEIPEDGEYELEIRDAIYRGREDFVYRVAIGELPFVTSVFPLGGRAGAKTVAALGGWHLSRKRLRLDTRPGPLGIRKMRLAKGLPSNEILYHVDTLPECHEKEPNDDARKAQKVSLPQIVNGRIDQPGDLDVFAFRGRAGQRVIVEVLGRRLHSPIDSLLRVTNSRGELLALNDDAVRKEGHLHTDMGYLTHHADSYVNLKLPRNDLYYAHLSDAQNQGSDACAYRLRITPIRPDFMLLVAPSSLTLQGGRVLPITVHAIRKAGFNGEIELGLKDAPKGFSLSAARIPPGRNRAGLTLTAPKEATDHPIPLQIVGRAKVGGRQTIRQVTPCDDVMQAFLWRHLAPSQDLLVTVTKARWNGLPLTMPDDEMIRVPMGGKGEVRMQTKVPRRLNNVELELKDAPEGVSVEDIVATRNALEFSIKVAGEAAKPGFSDNLIIEAFAQYPARGKGKNKDKSTNKTRRVSVGYLPAVSFEVVRR